MPAKDQGLIQFLEDERFQESQSIHTIFTGFSIVFLSFSLLDWLIFPEKFEEFFALRIAYCIVPFGILLLARRTRNFHQTQFLALFHAAVASGIITYMISQTGGVHSPYYAGLNLVGIIALCFFTFSAVFFWITAVSIYLPYFFVVTTPFLGNQIEPQELALNSFFMLGTLMVSSLIHYFRENFRRSYAEARLNLKHELTHRNEIIEKKTQEAVRLNSLSSQFSPQIVQSIREGKILLQGKNQRTRICSVFVDIVNSTDRVVRLPEGQVESVISKFLEDTVKILLKYDVTIDKFL
ncbi:MAG: hypothetical protein WCH11_02625 [Bdellovibrio sp.]